MLVGFHVEGWDYLVLRAYLAKSLDIPQAEISADWIDGPGRGWQFILAELPRALRRFYYECAQLVIIGIDNDGSEDVLKKGIQEDPKRPRHWLHTISPQPDTSCRRCELFRIVEETRPTLNWQPKKPGQMWPIVIAVPVETIEAWLLVSQAIMHPGQGSLHAENESRSGQKQRFYGMPEATRDAVESIALPLIATMQAVHLARLGDHAKSFAEFVEQIATLRERILTDPDCW